MVLVTRDDIIGMRGARDLMAKALALAIIGNQ